MAVQVVQVLVDKVASALLSAVPYRLLQVKRFTSTSAGKTVSTVAALVANLLVTVVALQTSEAMATA